MIHRAGWAQAPTLHQANKFCALLSLLQAAQVAQYFITINNMKFRRFL